ncbi:hypothetical protein BofuT4_uP106260.1 [Botrytis cinerea T4]|uniref:Uncharacterized protein n=1 Tax=Botryotinia fuckeliana (strain T4) TaxID=999810 RepID=G2Y8H9_BOTF4|nr:hypothetical protein BofuT4_uP106260.1 [Botrytis cinerea T4]
MSVASHGGELSLPTIGKRANTFVVSLRLDTRRFCVAVEANWQIWPLKIELSR